MVKPPKLKHLDVPEFAELLRGVQLMSDTSQSLANMVRAIREKAEAQVEEHRQTMQKHIDRTDLRPRVNFKPQPKNNWTVAFNNIVYSLGPYDPLPSDHEEPQFWWRNGDGERKPARSMFQALIAIVQDYCNQEE